MTQMCKAAKSCSFNWFTFVLSTATRKPTILSTKHRQYNNRLALVGQYAQYLPSEHRQYNRQVSTSRLGRLAPAIRTSLVQKTGQYQQASTPSICHRNITSTKERLVLVGQYAQHLPSKHHQYKRQVSTSRLGRLALAIRTSLVHKKGQYQQARTPSTCHRNITSTIDRFVLINQDAWHLSSEHHQYKRQAPAIRTSLVQKTGQYQQASTPYTCHRNITSTKDRLVLVGQYAQHLPSEHHQYKRSLELVVRPAPVIETLLVQKTGHY